ncbi:hypothetical protein IFM89_024143 [Coptis chinensis]|uniref:Disease resistance protein At4g27190-like leucine-rich repeats domain-containing protein n=1 Tax=Coptis chinensis TaxID=261450 RepID=A0A835M1G8_9MAGN|nr:hypothetical protein IFM89_024143 [Coptis chinensis]
MCASPGILKDGSFGNLKHLQLEYCPQVVTIFSSGVCLESLEVLEIKFCARLEEIFLAKVNADGSLRRLHTLLCLLELPTLKSIVHNVHLVSLKKSTIAENRANKLEGKMATVNDFAGKCKKVVVEAKEAYDRMVTELEELEDMYEQLGVEHEQLKEAYARAIAGEKGVSLTVDDIAVLAMVPTATAPVVESLVETDQGASD